MEEEMQELKAALTEGAGLVIPTAISFEELERRLAEHISELLSKDLNGVLQILYRIDVREDRVKKELRLQADKDAGWVIARLIIERQLEKLKTRRAFRRDENMNEEEKW